MSRTCVSLPGLPTITEETIPRSIARRRKKIRTESLHATAMPTARNIGGNSNDKKTLHAVFDFETFILDSAWLSAEERTERVDDDPDVAVTEMLVQEYINSRVHTTITLIVLSPRNIARLRMVRIPCLSGTHGIFISKYQNPNTLHYYLKLSTERPAKPTTADGSSSDETSGEGIKCAANGMVFAILFTTLPNNKFVVNGVYYHGHGSPVYTPNFNGKEKDLRACKPYDTFVADSAHAVKTLKSLKKKRAKSMSTAIDMHELEEEEDAEEVDAVAVIAEKETVAAVADTTRRRTHVRGHARTRTHTPTMTHPHARATVSAAATASATVTAVAGSSKSGIRKQRSCPNLKDQQSKSKTKNKKFKAQKGDSRLLNGSRKSQKKQRSDSHDIQRTRRDTYTPGHKKQRSSRSSSNGHKKHSKHLSECSDILPDDEDDDEDEDEDEETYNFHRDRSNLRKKKSKQNKVSVCGGDLFRPPEYSHNTKSSIDSALNSTLSPIKESKRVSLRSYALRTKSKSAMSLTLRPSIAKSRRRVCEPV